MWLKLLLDTSQLQGVQKLRLELERESFDEKRLTSIANELASLSSRHFERPSEPVLQAWSKPITVDGIAEQAQQDVRSQTSTSFSCVTMIWTSRWLFKGRRKHSEDYFTLNGELEDFVSQRQKSKARVRKRGGRRSLPATYRTHWLRRYTDVYELEFLRRQDRAAELTE